MFALPDTSNEHAEVYLLYVEVEMLFGYLGSDFALVTLRVHLVELFGKDEGRMGVCELTHVDC